MLPFFGCNPFDPFDRPIDKLRVWRLSDSVRLRAFSGVHPLIFYAGSTI